jgi:tetratricopeptide (TPR) repeat protein
VALEALAERFPGAGAVLRAQGMAALALGDTSRGRALLERALEDAQDPTRAVTLLLLATLQKDLKEHAAACPHALEAVGLAPRSSTLNALAGELLFRLRRHDEALPYLGAALELDPTRSRHWKLRSITHSRKGDGDGALHDANARLLLQPDEADAWVQVGSLLLRAGQLPGAQQCLEQAVRRDPSDRRAWARLALAALDLEDLHTAERALERGRSLGRDPTTDLLMAQARLQTARGQAVAARATIDALLNLPEKELSPGARELAEKLLRELAE